MKAAWVFKTDLGWVGISGTEEGPDRFILPRADFDEVCRELNVELRPSAEVPASLTGIAERLKQYFNGYKTAFPDKVDLTKYSDFQRRVWEVTRLIPYGETRSYSWVAEKTGNRNAVRAAGQALGANPLPVIIPCHRVLTKDGTMGGYSGGIDMKRYLLWREASAYMRDRSS